MTTPYKALPLPTQGVTTTWGDALNNYPFTYLDSMIGGITTKTLSSSDVALSVAESRTLAVRLTGTLSANVLVTTVCQGFTLVENLTSGAFTVTFTNVATYGGTAVGTPVTLPQGGGYVVLSDTTNGSRLVLPTSTSAAASVGRIAEFPGTTVPSGWLKANGALVSRASYPALWTFATLSGNLQTDAAWTSAAMYGCFSSGDGSTTFRLPDLRGYFRRGAADDATGNQDYGRSAGSFQDQALLTHVHTATTSVESQGHTHSGYVPTVAGYSTGSGATQMYAHDLLGTKTTTGESQTHTHNLTTSPVGGAQNRPQNVALMTCIAYV